MEKNLGQYTGKKVTRYLEDPYVHRRLLSILHDSFTLGLAAVIAHGNFTEQEIIAAGGVNLSGSVINEINNLQFLSQNEFTGTLVTIQGPSDILVGTFFLSLPSETGTFATREWVTQNTTAGDDPSLQTVTNEGNVTTNDIETSAGVILSAPNGSRWRVSVENDGSISTSPL